MINPVRRLDSPRPLLHHSLQAGTRLYAIGDIHGRLDLLDSLLRGIAIDAAQSAAPHKRVLFLGDVIDRGPQSAAVVEKLRRGPVEMRPGDMRPGDMRDVRWICLRGNHEDTLLNFLADPEEYGPRWLANGGLATISSYVGEPVESLMPQGRNWDRHTLMLLRDALAAALPTAHRSFLEALPSYHMEGDFLFVHAGLRPGIALADQTIRDLLWIRHDFLGSEIDHGPMIVHGHTIAAAPDVQANRIGVDTGAYASGHLTALVLEGHSLHFLTT